MEDPELSGAKNVEPSEHGGSGAGSQLGRRPPLAVCSNARNMCRKQTKQTEKAA